MIGGNEIANYNIKIFISDCTNYGPVLLEGQKATYVGGIISFVSSVADITISGCTNYGDILGLGEEYYFAGILGYDKGKYIHISDCINNGSIGNGINGGSYIAGIASYVYGTDLLLTQCINKGNLLVGEGSGEYTYSYVGGIVGTFRHSSDSAAAITGQDVSKIILSDCKNEGNIGREDVNILGSHMGGVVSVINGTIDNCSNIGNIYAGNNYIGGVFGRINAATTTVRISNCVNGFEGRQDAGIIKLKGTCSNIGGVIGGAEQYGSYHIDIYISDCANYGPIVLEEGMKAAYIAGIMGLKGGDNYLELTNCVNYGDIINGYLYAAGILGASLRTEGSLNASQCINYGNIIASERIGEDTSYGHIGGIVGKISSKGGISDCINVGNITGSKYVGGLVGYVAGFASSNVNPYLVNSYSLGDISGAEPEAGGIVGFIDTAPVLIEDCYASGNFMQALPSNINANIELNWSAKDDALDYGYLTEDVYTSLCEIQGVLDGEWIDDKRAMIEQLQKLFSIYNLLAEGIGYSIFSNDLEIEM